jgi:hypothetical protein
MRREIVEKALTENPPKGWLTRANGFMKLSKGTPEKSGWQEQGGGPLRFRVIRSEHVAQGRVAEPAVGCDGKTPRVLRARDRHSSEDGCAPESPASSVTLLGPEVSKSAIRNLLAACIACAAIMPGQMYSIGLDTVLLLWIYSLRENRERPNRPALFPIKNRPAIVRVQGPHQFFRDLL